MPDQTTDKRATHSDSTALSFSIAGAVQASGLPRTRIFALIGAGVLDARKCGRRTVIPASALREYLASLPPVQRRGAPVQPQQAA